MSKIKILYANINSYYSKKHLINYYVEKNDIKCNMFVETKTGINTLTNYRDWITIQKHGNVVNTNVRGGSLIQCAKHLKIGKANPPHFNNPLNETIHCTIPFKNNKIHIFLTYIHPNSATIEDNLFVKASQYEYAIIIGDFNVNNRKKKQIQHFLNNSDFVQISTPPTFIMANNENSTPDLFFCTKKY